MNELLLKMIFLILISIVLIIYLYFEYCYKYWLWRGVITPKPTFPFGNIKDSVLSRKFIGFQHKEFYDFFTSKGLKHGGIYMFNDPVYVAIEPEVIKHVLIKDFQCFSSRGLSVDDQSEPLSANLINLDGAKWKFLRSKLTPTFTSGKMKMMFPIIKNCADQMKVILDSVSGAVDMKDILARYTTDVIGSCAFGIECNSLKDPEVTFRKYGQRMFQRSFMDSFKRILLMTPIGKYLHEMRLMKIGKKDVANFFYNLTQEIVSYREKGNIERNDFLQLLIQLKNKDDNETKFSMDQITAQTILFFAAGFETSSSTMNFCIFELAQHPEIQDKLRTEIDYYLKKDNDELTYEAVMSMPYLDMVVSETLRKYPIAASLSRKSTQQYEIPNSTISLEKGTAVIIPVYGLHHDPKYFPDPEVFDPERFSDDMKKKRESCCYLPFGDGPRNCIGMRFGLMQTKIGLIYIVRNFLISLNQKTQLPIEAKTRSIVLTPKQIIWIDLEKI